MHPLTWFDEMPTEIYTDGLMLIGDAAGLPEPYLASGIYEAMYSGRLAAEVAAEAVEKGDTGKGFLKQYYDRLEASPVGQQFVGGKLGVDATGDEVNNGVIELLNDETLFEKLHKVDSHIVALKQYFIETKNPVCVLMVEKNESMKNLMEKVVPFAKHIKVLIIVDKKNNELDNPYMLLWRVTNNIDAQRDVRLEPFIMIDGTNKSELDNFQREWPGDTFCTKEVLDMIQEKGLIEIDEAFIKKFGLLPF